jgi:KDO2-lipid IV(A) lauroyltransferase
MFKLKNIIVELINLIFILLMPFLAFMPLFIRKGFARLLSSLLYFIKFFRIAVVKTNLNVCFPKFADDKLDLLTKSCIYNICFGFTENAISWHRSDKFIKDMVSVSNFEIIEKYNNEGCPVIILLPHFTHMFLAIRCIRILTPGSGIRKQQKSKVFEFYYDRCFNKNNINDILQHEVKKAITLLRKKNNFILLPDSDLGEKNSVFADFFGIKAATVTSVSKFARLGGAKVVAVNFYRNEDYSYNMEFEDLSHEMTLTNLEQDATLINKTFENYIRTNPSQYGWLHRRFKTRPPGEKSIY